MRFVDEGEPTEKFVLYYNISIKTSDFNNMRLQRSVRFLPASQVRGVEMNLGLFSVYEKEDGTMVAEKQEVSGEMTYSGGEKLAAGEIVAVYDGVLAEDGTVDGDVGYVKITADLGGGKYAYEGPDFDDVVFSPDMIPVRDDGSFEDGEILLTGDQMVFQGELYDELGLNASTVVEAGDMITVYSGSLEDPDSLALVGYGQITEAAAAEGGDADTFDLKTVTVTIVVAGQ